MSEMSPERLVRSIRMNIGLSLTVSGLLIAGGGLAATVEIAGAVMATGNVVVNSEVKKVQHPVGGTISEIRVANGQRVQAGELLARLEPTLAQANLAIISAALDEVLAKRARLLAERDGLTEIVFDSELVTRDRDQNTKDVLNAELRAFNLRHDARQGEKAQLEERIVQLDEQVKGLEQQAEAMETQVSLASRDLELAQKMFKQQLVQYTRLNGAEREKADLDGQLAGIRASIAQTRARISETKLEIFQIDQKLRGEVARELTEVSASISELRERKLSAEDQLRRLDIRAPQDGTIHQLAIHTIGGVVTPQEILMLIVPQSDLLVADVRIAPADIDQVTIGQGAFLRFPAFNQRLTPELNGTVERVSPDLITDTQTRTSYYAARVTLDPEGQHLALKPGMPVEAFLRTSDRTVGSYLTKPMTDFFTRAFRSE
ncbi:HlyD family type I secretion periplasmic adaptor subunit [Rhizobium sp. AQ_MP]|uniref:HlyD family type I secretion periplasmic adaptor subunit n=1 Tax=Rhizobium sp. AQ_MP TaxID=2761536 RepID=UPI001639A4BF|nr:HlyD family type I secretion periplasmic adaptor subunit [Rhizobium sp. AQ_MP]MBC2774792.1 HlyD family type I secretion periplasmic adaptor subunit [Rhizobium sp. AQ_MP]